MSKDKDKPVTPTFAERAARVTHEQPLFVAKPKRDKKEGRFYPMTFRIPRPTADRLSGIAHERKTSLQAICAEAVDKWLREQGEGAFLPEGWEE